jgi:hypothetical protein
MSTDQFPRLIQDTYKSVKVSVIARAFACAHHYSQNAGSNDDRARFRHIARLIWDACGEESSMPHVLPANLKVLIDAGEFRDLTETPPGRAVEPATEPQNHTEAKS